MGLLKKQNNLLIAFASVCFALLSVATSVLMFMMYHHDDTVIASVEEIRFEVAETEASTIATTPIYESEPPLIENDSTKYGLVDLVNRETEPQVHTQEIIDLSILRAPDYLPKYKYGKRITPSVEIPETKSDTDMRNYTEDVDTDEYLYIGTYKITGYAPKCYHCCGNVKGISASGVEAVAGYTVAASPNIPFGTTLYIEGYGYYVVEDRGNLGYNVIDIAAPNHESCYNLTNTGVNVYVVPQNNN